MTDTQLVIPSLQYLSGYRDALEHGWSPDNVRAGVADEQLAKIAADAAGFIDGLDIDGLDDPEGRGEPIRLPDGTIVPRLPGFIRWVWDGEFCGSVGLRWQPGGATLPAHVLGRIGYTIVPWKQGLGHATRALRLLLPMARDYGLSFVELTTDPANLASQRVILANGGRLVERFRKPAAYGGADGLRYRIELGAQP